MLAENTNPRRQAVLNWTSPQTPRGTDRLPKERIFEADTSGQQTLSQTCVKKNQPNGRSPHTKRIGRRLMLTTQFLLLLIAASGEVRRVKILSPSDGSSLCATDPLQMHVRIHGMEVPSEGYGDVYLDEQVRCFAVFFLLFCKLL